MHNIMLSMLSAKEKNGHRSALSVVNCVWNLWFAYCQEAKRASGMEGKKVPTNLVISLLRKPMPPFYSLYSLWHFYLKEDLYRRAAQRNLQRDPRAAGRLYSAWKRSRVQMQPAPRRGAHPWPPRGPGGPNPRSSVPDAPFWWKAPLSPPSQTHTEFSAAPTPSASWWVLKQC